MKHIDSWSKLKIAVIGDVMLDRYWWGSVSRISPEAPVPIVKLDRTSIVAGGAANVAANIAGLGAVPYLVGITGDDDEASLFPEVLREAEIENFNLIAVKNRKTTVKTRIIAHNQQITRLDQETTDDLSADETTDIFNQIATLFEKTEINAIVVSDYAKGFLTRSFVKDLISFAGDMQKYILIDPKGKDYSKYAGATILTPNRMEAADACGLDIDSPNLVERSGELLLAELSLQSLLITQGEDGMTLLQKGKRSEHLHATARNVYDVTGAGDTVIATMSVALSSGMNFLDAARTANFAAGLVVEKLGTTPISKSDLNSIMLEAEPAV